MSDKKSGKLLLILVVLGLIVGGGLFVYKSYNGLKIKIKKEISEIEPFNSETVSVEIAKEMGVTLPIKKSPLPKATIKSDIKKELNKRAKESVSLSLLSLEIQSIIKKYSLAKVGEKVSFMLNTTGKRISGTYKGIFTDWKGKLIQVDYNKYRIYDIGEESRYMFNPVLAQKRASEEVEIARVEFKSKKKDVIKAIVEEVTKRHFEKGGYAMRDGKWQENIIVFNELLKEAEEKCEKEKERKIKNIYEDNKLFGIIPIELDKYIKSGEGIISE